VTEASTPHSKSTPTNPLARLPAEWQTWLKEQGEPSYRAGQIFKWIHERGVLDPEQMTDLSKALRARLIASGLQAPLSAEQVLRSSDNTRKLLLRLSDGRAVECVLIPMTNQDDADVAGAADDEDGSDGDGAYDTGYDAAYDGPEHGGRYDVQSSGALRDDAGAAEAHWQDESHAEPQRTAPQRRVTLCISTQVGCAMGCVFCASGKAGLTRGLTAAEVVAQVLIARRYLDPGENLRNLVFMGMGEPLHHWEETERALRLFTHPDGMGMSPRRITVSTVGLAPNIRKLGAAFGGKIGLALSLHAPDNATRDKIMPMNRRFDVATLITALREYPLPPRRRITIEYTLIADLNDTPAHARTLVRLLSGMRVKVNLIPMNPISGSELRASTPERVESFARALTQARINCSVRKRRGDDVDAACGQLALRHQAPSNPASVQPETSDAPRGLPVVS
jgi:23S rRNA (adenine2503-C2)-methyltransferase